MSFLRRSLRLIANGYYDSNGNPRINYRETRSKPFNKRRRRRFPFRFPLWNSSETDHYSDGKEFSGQVQGTWRSIPHLLCKLTLIGVPLMVVFLYAIMTLVNLYGSQSALSWPNYALESKGASIVHHRCTESHTVGPSGLIRGLIWNWFSKTRASHCAQRKLIQGSPPTGGDCWCFKGELGHLVVSLSQPVSISHVSIDHVTKAQSPYGHTKSAPKVFSVYGMMDDRDPGTYLGRFTYSWLGGTFQTFRVNNEPPREYPMVKILVERNYGFDYTCVYRLRVHAEGQ